MLAYTFLDKQRERLRQENDTHVTCGYAWRHTQQVHHRQLITWIVDAVENHHYSVTELSEELLV